eukprot:1697610-Rhodomonas_salina.6
MLGPWNSGVREAEGGRCVGSRTPKQSHKGDDAPGTPTTPSGKSRIDPTQVWPREASAHACGCKTASERARESEGGREGREGERSYTRACVIRGV